MPTSLDFQRADIPALCRQYGVDRLELFGSAITDALDPHGSDLDFLVQFDANPSKLFDRYFGLKVSLEALYDREVDLVMDGSLRNPYFIEAVKKTRQLLDAAEACGRLRKQKGEPGSQSARSQISLKESLKPTPESQSPSP